MDSLLLALGQSLSGYSPSYWNTFVSFLRQLTPAASMLKRRAIRVREFTPPPSDQWRAFLEACDANERSHAGLFVRFLSLTGLRISEARALTWGDLRGDWIVVPGRITKNGRPRAVPIVAALRDPLAGLRALDSAAGVSGHILPREVPRKAIRSACAAVGLAPLSFHCFRHWFATRTIEGGVDVPTVARWLGHSDGGALLGRAYFHLASEHANAAAAAAGAALRSG